MTETKQKTEPQPSNGFHKIVTGSSLMTRSKLLYLFTRLSMATTLPVIALAMWSTPGVAAERELIPDRQFERGIRIVSENVPLGTLYDGSRSGLPPVWTLGQWWTPESIRGEKSREERQPREWQHVYEEVFRGAQVGRLDLRNGSVTMGLDSVAVYDGLFRDGSVKDWPHFDLRSTLATPAQWKSGEIPSVAAMKRLHLRFRGQVLDARHNHETDRTGNRFNRRIHACKFHLFFCITNLNPDSEDFRNFLFFGVLVYDDRQEFLELRASNDKQSGKMIYDVGANALAPHITFHDGKAHTIEGNVLPHVKAGIERAVTAGKLKEPGLANYAVTSVIIGYETPGLSRMSFRVDEISLKASWDQTSPGMPNRAINAPARINRLADSGGVTKCR